MSVLCFLFKLGVMKIIRDITFSRQKKLFTFFKINTKNQNIPTSPKNIKITISFWMAECRPAALSTLLLGYQKKIPL